MRASPGDLIANRFEIERHVGAGAMGAVYRARDRERDQLVALKLVNATDAHTVTRFEREARALVELVHPCIVGYSAHGRVDDTVLYLAMEWLEGEDLGTRLEVSRLSIAEALECMKQAAAGLAVAHARGIVHRDVKPSNLFLVDWQPNKLKLLDFGVARFADLDALTRTGALVGTPLYMAPEQLTGETITARADVFALGAVVFHCITGRPPFVAKHLAELAAKLTSPEEAPRASTIVPATPALLDELLARMLAKQPEVRPADCASVLAALEAERIPSTPAIATADTIDVVARARIATAAKPLEQAHAAMAEGRWEDARVAFEKALADEDMIEARMGLADALWWLGDGREMVRQLEIVYERVHHLPDLEARFVGGAAALRIALSHKKVFGNNAATRGWLARAIRILGTEPGPLEPFLLIVQGLEATDPAHAVAFKRRALEIARGMNDRDMEIGAMAWLGHSLVSQGFVEEGIAMIDEAMAGVAGGECKQLDTVVGATCAMVTACDELADIDRLNQWVAASDRFLSKFGSPLLYADCRWHYGSALYATGQWADAERELRAAMRESRPDTDYHIGAASQLSEIYVHRGDFDAAEALVGRLGDHPITRRITGVIKHARGEHKVAIAYLQRFVDACGSSVVPAAGAIDRLIDAALDSGNVELARVAARRLAELARGHQNKIVIGHVAFAAGRVALAAGDRATAQAELERAIDVFSSSKLRLDAARARLALARALAQEPETIEIARLEAQSASQTFHEVGATRSAVAAETLLRTLGGA